MDAKASRLTAEERRLAEELLRRAPFAYLAMAAETGPYVVPVNFAYESMGEAPGPWGRLYLHTGKGRKSRTLARNPRVCIAVSADEAFVQGASACQDGFVFRSVVVEGQATLIRNQDGRERALRTIVAKYDPGAAGQAFAEDVLAQTLVYAVTIETVGYRQRPRRADG